LLKLLEHPLHQIAFFVDILIIRPQGFPVVSGRNDCPGTTGFDDRHKRIGVIALVGDHIVDGEAANQGFGLGIFRHLTRCQQKPDGVACLLALKPPLDLPIASCS